MAVTRLDQFETENNNLVRYKFLVTLLNSIADPLFVKDREHKWILLNDAFCAFYGAKREELIGKSDYDFFSKEQAAIFWETDRLVYETGKTNENEELFTGKSGITRTIITRKARYFDEAGDMFLVGTIRDISAKKEATAQRIKKEAAESASRMKSEFLDIAAHELRTPLTPLVLILEMAIRESTGNQPIPLPHLERALKQVDRLKRLVNDMLNASRLEHGTMALNSTETDLNSIITESLSDSKGRAPQRIFQLETTPEPLPVLVDAQRIYQVMANFLDNAIKYTPENTPIQVRSIMRPGIARVEVVDQGMGISKDLEKKLFTRFFRANNSSNSYHAGLGLGLYICRQIAELHGGTVGVESVPGKGSTFYLELPLLVFARG